MWFLIKGTFWFTLVLVALSFIGGNQSAQSTSQFQLGNAISAATGAYDYVSGLCSTKPDVCVKGAQTFTAIGERAREGALVAFQLLNRHFGDGSSAATSEADLSADKDGNKEGPAIADHVVTGTVSHPTVINIPKPRVKPVD
jgi:hypothetical protein